MVQASIKNLEFQNSYAYKMDKSPVIFNWRQLTGGFTSKQSQIAIPDSNSRNWWHSEYEAGNVFTASQNCVAPLKEAL